MRRDVRPVNAEISKIQGGCLISRSRRIDGVSEGHGPYLLPMKVMMVPHHLLDLELVAIEKLTKIFNEADQNNNGRSREPNQEHGLKNSHAADKKIGHPS
jgi:hypothetical protein